VEKKVFYCPQGAHLDKLPTHIIPLATLNINYPGPTSSLGGEEGVAVSCSKILYNSPLFPGQERQKGETDSFCGK